MSRMRVPDRILLGLLIIFMTINQSVASDGGVDQLESGGTVSNQVTTYDKIEPGITDFAINPVSLKDSVEQNKIQLTKLTTSSKVNESDITSLETKVGALASQMK